MKTNELIVAYLEITSCDIKYIINIYSIIAKLQYNISFLPNVKASAHTIRKQKENMNYIY